MLQHGIHDPPRSIRALGLHCTCQQTQQDYRTSSNTHQSFTPNPIYEENWRPTPHLMQTTIALAPAGINRL
jgi:hypothetical protein